MELRLSPSSPTMHLSPASVLRRPFSCGAHCTTGRPLSPGERTGTLQRLPLFPVRGLSAPDRLVLPLIYEMIASLDHFFPNILQVLCQQGAVFTEALQA